MILVFMVASFTFLLIVHFTFSMSPGFQVLLIAASVGEFLQGASRDAYPISVKESKHHPTRPSPTELTVNLFSARNSHFGLPRLFSRQRYAGGFARYDRQFQILYTDDP